jgi:hypothetical protein
MPRVADVQRSLYGPVDAVDNATIRLPLGVSVPNPGRLREHDLHHVALGVGTGLRGEIAVSALEWRNGPPTLLIAILCLGALVISAVVWPRRTLELYRRVAGWRVAYGEPTTPLYAGTVAELRAHLGMPPDGLDDPFWTAP